MTPAHYIAIGAGLATAIYAALAWAIIHFGTRAAQRFVREWVGG